MLLHFTLPQYSTIQKKQEKNSYKRDLKSQNKPKRDCLSILSLNPECLRVCKWQLRAGVERWNMNPSQLCIKECVENPQHLHTQSPAHPYTHRTLLTHLLYTEHTVYLHCSCVLKKKRWWQLRTRPPLLKGPIISAWHTENNCSLWWQPSSHYTMHTQATFLNYYMFPITCNYFFYRKSCFTLRGTKDQA